MKKCGNCKQPIAWDNYWTAWEHTNRDRKMTAELCDPDKGFGNSTVAVP